MKKIILFSLTFCLLSIFVFAAPPKSDNGIKFQEINYSTALQKAKKEYKYVFMNVYAVWCGPCKMLKKNTFQSPKVASAFNKSFINIDIDAEKGEGIQLAKKYDIQAHPLMLVLDQNGKVVKRILGYMKDDELLTQVKDFLK